MSAKLPYISRPTTVTTLLNKIRDAATPERFTYEYIEKTLGLKGGNYKHFVSLAKKMGLLNPDGAPSELYKKFRNKDSAGAAIASAIRVGYKPIFEKNENAGDLSKDQIKGLIVEVTGLKSSDRVTQLISQTYECFKAFADFKSVIKDKKAHPHHEKQDEKGDVDGSGLGLNLAYTINLVLPKSDDPAVFNAIFRSLRENLLRK